MGNVRVVIERAGSRLELEGEQAFVDAQLKLLLPIVTAEMDGTENPTPELEGGTPEDGAKARARQSLPSFVAAKKPQNVYQAIAAVLFHRAKVERKEELSGTEIRDALVQGRHRPPTMMPQALTDCRRKYGYIQPGSKKGLWKLTHTGETMVEFDLPRKEA